MSRSCPGKLLKPVQVCVWGERGQVVAPKTIREFTDTKYSFLLQHVAMGNILSLSDFSSCLGLGITLLKQHIQGHFVAHVKAMNCNLL